MSWNHDRSEGLLDISWGETRINDSIRPKYRCSVMVIILHSSNRVIGMYDGTTFDITFEKLTLVPKFGVHPNTHTLISLLCGKVCSLMSTYSVGAALSVEHIQSLSLIMSLFKS